MTKDDLLSKMYLLTELQKAVMNYILENQYYGF